MKRKALFCNKGSKQLKEFSHTETCAHVVKFLSVCTILIFSDIHKFKNMAIYFDHLNWHPKISFSPRTSADDDVVLKLRKTYMV